MRNEGATTVITAKRLVLALCAAGVVGGAVGAITVNHNSAVAQAAPAVLAAAPAAAASAPVPGAPAPLAAGVVLPDFTAIVARNGPAVVNIRVMGSTKTAMGRQGMPQLDESDPFYEFFQRFQGPQNPRAQRDRPVFGAGSGFIISPDGVILTNAHVVRDATEVTVKLQDRREYRAKVLGSDPRTDVAVLKIDARNLPVVPVGRSSDLKVGEWVLAIGSPFGLESSVTAGVVSAKGRSLPDDSKVPFIQTDVAVNPGNSGGPLFNTKGEVIGINSQIYSQTGGYMGLSFAIPIDLAFRIKDQIVATGKAQHAKLGVVIQEVNQAFADSFKLDSPEGALVSNVEKGGAADKAGIKSGDVIRKLNGQPIIASGDLPAMLSTSKPGDKVTLDVWRDGRIVRLDARLANADDKVAAADVPDALSPDSSSRLGLALRPLEPMERRQSGISGGLVIEDAGGAAANAGVQPGDVLLSVNGRPVNSVGDVRDVVSKSSKSVALLIQRGGDRIFIPVRIG
ncbi:DegQ family serine endoprotease [Massilia sp. PAMC28688]|uniref:DegQ family serine endoprotease n=1 Tax=Massilia sp. PAMC28688 TaxID=2861283 RepID=UPI001C631B6A|nr:DegQ family serine endoprotease [Massilia sp. PAMC28688]QYF92114.1 DegQ family serine endoprotease [Massilia sp. PAMC28688]